MHESRFNHNYRASGSDRVPIGAGDKYWAQDIARDHRYLQNLSARALLDVFGSASALISGGAVTEGSSKAQVNVGAAVGLCSFSVEVPDDSVAWSVPAAYKNEVIKVRVSCPAVTNLALGGTLDGVTTNYVKLRFAEADGSYTRTRYSASGDYVFTKKDSYQLVANAMAPTEYDVLLATYVGNGTTTLAITQSAVSDIKSDVLPSTAQLQAYPATTAGVGCLIQTDIPVTAVGAMIEGVIRGNTHGLKGGLYVAFECHNQASPNIFEYYAGHQMGLNPTTQITLFGYGGKFAVYVPSFSTLGTVRAEIYCANLDSGVARNRVTSITNVAMPTADAAPASVAVTLYPLLRVTNTVRFLTSGSWVVPDRVWQIRVRGVGGGGGGGGGGPMQSGVQYGGGGGGGSGFLNSQIGWAYMTVTPGETLTVVVGAGGAGGIAGAAGGMGGQTGLLRGASVIYGYCLGGAGGSPGLVGTPGIGGRTTWIGAEVDGQSGSFGGAFNNGSAGMGGGGAIGGRGGVGGQPGVAASCRGGGGGGGGGDGSFGAGDGGNGGDGVLDIEF